jgi:hypothetical protein
MTVDRSQDGGARMAEPGWWSQDGGARTAEPGWWSQDGGARMVEPGRRSQDGGARTAEPGGLRTNSPRTKIFETTKKLRIHKQTVQKIQ